MAEPEHQGGPPPPSYQDVISSPTAPPPPPGDPDSKPPLGASDVQWQFDPATGAVHPPHSYQPAAGAPYPPQQYGVQPPGTQPEGTAYPQQPYQPVAGAPYPQQAYGQPQAVQYTQSTYVQGGEPVQQVIVLRDGQTLTNPPRDYLWGSILACLCCCMPLGVVAIVYSCRSRDASRRGDLQSAEDSSRTARQFIIAAVVCGLVITAINVILRLALNVY